MSFLDHIRACNAHDIAAYRRLTVAGRGAGWVRHGLAARLAAFPEVFAVADAEVALAPGLATPQARTEAVGRVAAALDLPRTGEAYPVVERFGAEPLLLLDRGLAAHFGIRAFGLHVNGWLRNADGLCLWIGKRAADRAVAPGKLDNMVAGGQPHGLSLAENLRKEAREEAGLPDRVIDRAVPVGAITYTMENANGLKPDTLFLYDLEMPAGVVPRNTDGELEEFRLMPAEAVAERVRAGDDFKFNVNLVIIDFLLRHGLLDPDSEPDYLDLVQGLRRAQP